MKAVNFRAPVYAKVRKAGMGRVPQIANGPDPPRGCARLPAGAESDDAASRNSSELRGSLLAKASRLPPRDGRAGFSRPSWICARENLVGLSFKPPKPVSLSEAKKIHGPKRAPQVSMADFSLRAE